MLVEFAAIAEIIASLGVILSLLFVGFQMRENNRQSRMSAIQDSLEYELQVSSQFIANAELWDKMMSGQPLATGAERRKAIQLYNLLMTETEHRYFLFKQGYLVNKSWQARLDVFRENVPGDMYRLWRNSPAGKSHSPEFLELLDRIIKERSPGEMPDAGQHR